ncbi:MAG: hypothetical protein M3077_08070 [Candidatus Dormibacteraeota bacterium]|nr:hypothetical protein [Candidatus Dormibacteraeota bacterium]
MAILLALNTLGRLGVVGQFGVAAGISPGIGIALLAITGLAYLLACLGAFFLLRVPARLHWWLALLLPFFAAANIATAVVVTPPDHIGVGLVLDVYLFNALLTLVVIGLLLKRAVRTYFGVSRSSVGRAKAA